MRILVLNYEFPPLGGGASPISYEISEEYVKAGHQVDVVTMGFKDLPRFELVKENFRVYRVPCLRSKKEMSHPWEQLTYLISAYFCCRRLLKTYSYNVCHTHFILPTGVLALKLKKRFSLPYIITSQGSDVLGHNPRFKYLYPLVRGVWKKIINQAVKVVVPSDFLRSEILQAYPVAAERTMVIPDGIASGKFKSLPKKKTILLVGRLFKNKGVQDLINALKGVDLPDWSVMIIGDGPYRTELEQLVARANLQFTISFLGWVDNKSEQLKKFYGEATIFVSPSYFESFGLNVLEAMQAGVIPLISDIPPYRAFLNKEELLFPVGDVAELQRKLLALIKQISSSDVRPYDFTQLVKSRFEWPVITKKYLLELEKAQLI